MFPGFATELTETMVIVNPDHYQLNPNTDILAMRLYITTDDPIPRTG